MEHEVKNIVGVVEAPEFGEDEETQNTLYDILRIIDPDFNPERFLIIQEGSVLKIYEVS